MNTDIKEQWLNALRSGKYEQGYDVLVGPTQHCCLGVLCEVQGIPKSNEIFQFELEEQDEANFYVGSLPNSFLNKVGLTQADQNRLVKMNDDDGKTFDQIADWIDENL
jgi:hypothetical protein